MRWNSIAVMSAAITIGRWTSWWIFINILNATWLVKISFNIIPEFPLFIFKIVLWIILRGAATMNDPRYFCSIRNCEMGNFFLTKCRGVTLNFKFDASIESRTIYKFLLVIIWLQRTFIAFNICFGKIDEQN